MGRPCGRHCAGGLGLAAISLNHRITSADQVQVARIWKPGGNISKPICRPNSRKVFDEPVARRTARGRKVLDIGIEVTAAEQGQFLRLERAVICCYCLIGHGEMIARRDDHQKGSWADIFDIGARFILGEQLDRLQRDLIAPGRRAQFACLGEPLIGVGRAHGRPGSFDTTAIMP